jgi:hypothetical protein
MKNEIQFLNTAKVITIFLVIYDHLSIPEVVNEIWPASPAGTALY